MVTMAQNLLRALGQSYTPTYDCAVNNNRSKVTKADDDQITITPNPAYNTIQIRLNDGQSISTVQCRNLEGKIVKVLTNGQLDVIDISNLNPGVYIIRVTLSNGSVTDKRFIKIN